MKQPVIQVIIISLLVILAGAIVTGLMISTRLHQVSQEPGVSFDEEKSHLLIIVDSVDPSYRDSFYEGVEVAAGESDAYVEYIKIKEEDYIDALKEQLLLAKYIDVDGVIIHSIYDQDLAAMIKDLFREGIPVITLNDDVPASNRISFIGINRYQVGKEVGRVFKDQEGEGKTHDTVVVIDGKTTNSQVQERLVYGLLDGLDKEVLVHYETIDYSDQTLLTAEKTASDILQKLDGVTGIFCTDPMSTMGTMQVILDNNYVNAIDLIGTGKQEEILDAVNKGAVLDATLFIDHYDIGYQAVMAYQEYKETGFVSSYIHPKVDMVEGGASNEN